MCAYRYTCEPCYRYINTLIHQHILGYSTSTTTAHPHCCISLSLHHLGSKPVSLFAAIIYTNTSFAKDNLNQFFVQNFSQTPMSYKELLILLQSVSNIETRVITDYWFIKQQLPLSSLHCQYINISWKNSHYHNHHISAKIASSIHLICETGWVVKGYHMMTTRESGQQHTVNIHSVLHVFIHLYIYMYLYMIYTFLKHQIGLT